MLFGTCYVSYVALKVLEISRSRTQLEEKLKYADRSLMAQKKQFDSLSAHMDEMRKARHDLRQHLTVEMCIRDSSKGLQTGKSVGKDCSLFADNFVRRAFFVIANMVNWRTAVKLRLKTLFILSIKRYRNQCKNHRYTSIPRISFTAVVENIYGTNKC